MNNHSFGWYYVFEAERRMKIAFTDYQNCADRIPYDGITSDPVFEKEYYGRQAEYIKRLKEWEEIKDRYEAGEFEAIPAEISANVKGA